MSRDLQSTVGQLLMAGREPEDRDPGFQEYVQTHSESASVTCTDLLGARTRSQK